MPDHPTGTREEWLAARVELLAAEKEHTRRGDELARQRQQLPWVRIDKEYRFDTDEGSASLADLFGGRSQLLMYHLMYGPEYTLGACPVCSTIADGFNGFAVHLANHDVAMIAVSRAPLAAIQAYKRRMGWTFPWASSFGTDFNFDFDVSTTEEQQRQGTVEYNYRTVDVSGILEAGPESPVARVGRHGRSRRGDVHPGGARHERVRAGRRRPLPHVLGLRPRVGRALGDVPVARSRPEGTQRAPGRAVVPPP